MLLRSTFDVLRRRQVLAAILVVLLAAGMVAAIRAVKPQYRATAAVFLVQPAANPYVAIGGDTGVLSRVVATLAADDASTADLAAVGATAPYTVTGGGPFDPTVVVTATSHDRALAARTAAAAARRVAGELGAVQARERIPAQFRITSSPLTGVSVQSYSKDRSRLLALVGAAGLAGAVLLIFAVEAFERRRDRSIGRLRAAARAVRSRLPYVAVATVLLVAGAAVVARAPRQYQASEVLIVVPPQLPLRPGVPLARQGALNPFLSYGNTFDVVAQLATTQVTTPAASADLAARAGSDGYQVVNWVAGPNPVDTVATPTPYIGITATGPDRAGAEAKVQAVGRAVVTAIVDLQDRNGAPADTRLQVVEAVPVQSYQLHLSRARAAGGLAVLAAAGAGLALRTLRRRRRAAAGPAGPEPLALRPLARVGGQG